MTKSVPRARKSGLVVRELGDETIVYDVGRHKAVCLNRAAALVWKSCDGKRGVDEIAARVARALDEPFDAELTRFAVERLARAKLLDGAVAATAPSRRDMLKRMGKAAAFALPFVLTMTVPQPAEAASCSCQVRTGQRCFNVTGCFVGAPCGRVCTRHCQSNGQCQ